jgi:ABC-type nitrate/sulfonate/bicarbonate transport system substrate-binding protein
MASSPAPVARITVHEDWTPNTNHTGFYVALAKGWYADARLEVHLVSADADNYETTPAKKVMTAAASAAQASSAPEVPGSVPHIPLGVCPSESVISACTLPGRPAALVAIAALANRDTSAIVTVSSSGIDRPASLDGKIYASYNARFEDRIVAAMIRADGGTGVFTASQPPKLGIWNTLLEGKADATWVFLPWEGVEAARKGVKLNAFTLDAYGIPYGYTPVLAASPADAKAHAPALRAFLAATARGYQYAAAHPDEAADLLRTASGHATLADAEFVRAAQAEAGKAYLTPDGGWGVMEAARWGAFVEWLRSEKILEGAGPDPASLFTNELLVGGDGEKAAVGADGGE